MKIGLISRIGPAILPPSRAAEEPRRRTSPPAGGRRAERKQTNLCQRRGPPLPREGSRFEHKAGRISTLHPPRRRSGLPALSRLAAAVVLFALSPASRAADAAPGRGEGPVSVLSIPASRGVAPGFINSKMTEVLPDNVKQQMLSIIPLKKFGEVSDIAKTVAFLASDNAAYITGQVISVNGGMLMP